MKVKKNLQHQKTYRGMVFSGPEVVQIPLRENLSVYQKKAGICFFPRTLNVKLDTDFEIPKNGIHINAEEIKTTGSPIGINLIPAVFRAERIFLMCPDHPTIKLNVIEIMASFDIRKQFNIQDNDYIEFEVEIE